MQSLEARVTSGPPVLMDGAMGTELEVRGVPMDDSTWCGVAVATSPATVREIHLDYMRIGAEIHIVNTYASAPHMLAWAGRESEAEALNRAAVRLAQEARDAAQPDHPTWIAGSLSTFNGANTDVLATERVRDSWRRQAEWLADSGCELLILEMMLVNRRTLSYEQQGELLNIAHEIGLPVWYGISCKSDDGTSATLYEDVIVAKHGNPRDKGATFDSVVAAVDFDKVAAIGIMHSDVPAIAPGLEVVRRHTDKPLLAYPNSGYFKMPQWQFEGIIPVDEFVTEAQRWVANGARIVGGCCGLGPEHIAGLHRNL